MSGVGIVGIILLIGGAIAFFIHRDQKTRSFSLKSARSATTAELQQIAKAVSQEIGGGSWRDYIKIRGIVQADQPLTSELKQEPCVYYRMTVVREYEETITERDSEGRTVQRTVRGSETISQNQQSIPFQLRDAAGSITVNPNNADLETVTILNEFRPGSEGGLISFGRFSRTLSTLSNPGRRTLGYRYTESILPLEREIFVVGTVSDSTGNLVVSKPTESGKKFIISLKTDEALTTSADRGAQISRYVMFICLGVGLVLIILDLLT